jgi:hypothetical protein
MKAMNNGDWMFSLILKGASADGLILSIIQTANIMGDKARDIHALAGSVKGPFREHNP